jgi:hypothetical protein
VIPGLNGASCRRQLDSSTSRSFFSASGTGWLVLPELEKSRSFGFEVLHGRNIKVYGREIGVREIVSRKRLQAQVAQNALKEGEGRDDSEMAKLITETILRLAWVKKYGPITGSLSDEQIQLLKKELNSRENRDARP